MFNNIQIPFVDELIILITDDRIESDKARSLLHKIAIDFIEIENDNIKLPVDTSNVPILIKYKYGKLSNVIHGYIPDKYLNTLGYYMTTI